MTYIREIKCKSVLSKSRIYGVNYSVNPYLGCEHGCFYCFARFMIKYAGQGMEWGEFVSVKTNSPRVLDLELCRAKKGLVLMSSVTDPYQPLEEKYELTRQILEILARYDFPVSILTKSHLVTRDVDIMKEFSNCEVGLTIVTLDERVREAFEPRAPQIKKRLEALWELHDSGIETYGFIGPMLPYLTEETLEDLLSKLTEVAVDRILVDRLNLKAGNWRTIQQALAKCYPELICMFERILFTRNEYYERLKLRISESCKRRNLKVDFCY
ncbi:MAG: radical SAM protein [Candidatus Bathyarchaeia archaeon]